MNDYQIKQVHYGLEYKVFVSRDGAELLRIDGLADYEAATVMEILEKARIEFLETTK